MSLNTCPVANIDAPFDRVWRFLSEPINYALWWDAQTRSITPIGRAITGQKIHAQSKALGKQWSVNILVEGLDERRHQVYLKTILPFGITVFNHITCTPLNNATTQVSFG